MKDLPEHEELLDANARTGWKGKGRPGSEVIKVLGAYGRDALNDNGERLVSFSANNRFALLNTFFSTVKNSTSYTFNVLGKIRNDEILTRQRDRNLVQDVTLHPQPSFLPISDHNVITAHVKLLDDRFARNRLVKRAKRPPLTDRRRLLNYPHLRQEVAKR